MNTTIDHLLTNVYELEGLLLKISSMGGYEEESAFIRDELIPCMGELRVPCDEAELLTAKPYWPFPTYADLLFGVK